MQRRLGGRAAVSLGLIVHELLTNAAKYGALSTPAGYLVVGCQREADKATLVWRESAEYPITAGGKVGFGTRLIKRLAEDLGGSARVHLLPTGLEATVSFWGGSSDGSVRPKLALPFAGRQGLAGQAGQSAAAEIREPLASGRDRGLPRR